MRFCRIETPGDAPKVKELDTVSVRGGVQLADRLVIEIDRFAESFERLAQTASGVKYAVAREEDTMGFSILAKA